MNLHDMYLKKCKKPKETYITSNDIKNATKIRTMLDDTLKVYQFNSTINLWINQSTRAKLPACELLWELNNILKNKNLYRQIIIEIKRPNKKIAFSASRRHKIEKYEEVKEF